MKAVPALIVFLVSLLAAKPAQAYLDPSTGSMIVTAIVGLFASIALAVKTYWYKLKAFFRGKKKSRPKPDVSEQADAPERTSRD